MPGLARTRFLWPVLLILPLILGGSQGVTGRNIPAASDVLTATYAMNFAAGVDKAVFNDQAARHNIISGFGLSSIPGGNGILKLDQTTLLRWHQYFALFFVLIIILLAGTFGWSWSLRSQVRKRTAALQESETMFQSLVENLPQNVFRKDLQGRFTFANQVYCQTRGETLEGILGKTVFDIFPQELAQRYEAEDRRIFETGEKYEAIDEIQTNEGEKIYVQVIKSPVYAADGQLTGVQGIFWDITEHKQTEAALQRAHEDLEKQVQVRTAELEASNRELEAFSYSVSHDLRAPLRAVSGFSRILVEDYAANIPAEAQHYLERIQDNARQMGQLIDDLLAFSRLSRQPLTMRPFHPGEMVRQIIDDLRMDQNGRRIDVLIRDMPLCKGDPALLKQVYVNLLSNAFKFTRQREVARIEIGCVPANGTLASGNGSKGKHIYFIKDNGVGFDMQYSDKLFGVFQRLHRPEEYEGTGVGLAIVQRIIRRHGGRVWAEAEVNEGATFYFEV